MFTPNWPSSLPQSLESSSFNMELDDGAAIRTENDSGPAFQRPRYSATTEKVSGSITVNRVQYATFIQFYNVDLSQGSLAFNWIDFLTEDESRVRFDVKNPPTFTMRSPGNISINMNIEILP